VGGRGQAGGNDNAIVMTNANDSIPESGAPAGRETSRRPHCGQLAIIGGYYA